MTAKTFKGNPCTSTISAIYQDCSPIKLFFEALKQNLKVKSLVGASENALHLKWLDTDIGRFRNDRRDWFRPPRSASPSAPSG